MKALLFEAVALNPELGRAGWNGAPLSEGRLKRSVAARPGPAVCY
jgi:hypothetical protein